MVYIIVETGLTPSLLMEIIILLAHGSPEKYAKETLISLVKEFTGCLKKNKKMIYCAFLQFNRPNLEECLIPILNSKCPLSSMKIIILPVFVSHGSHTLKDVPAIIKKLKKIYKGLNIKLALPLGNDKLLVKLLYKRYREVASSRH